MLATLKRNARNASLVGLVLASMLGAVCESALAATFDNPIVPANGPAGAADPSVVYRDGFYYWVRSIEDSRIGIAKSKRLQDIGTAPMTVVWTPPVGTAYSKDLWAPELSYLNGRWYIHFAADDGNNTNHRMYALEANTQNPQGSYTFRGKVAASADVWAIDGTVLQKDDGSLYFVWSGWNGANDGFPQRIYIAPMSNPYTISGSRVEIAAPTYNWETVGAALLEGPEVIKKNGRINIVYSASGSWTDDYKLGLISNTDGNVLNPGSWVKKNTPVFEKNPGGQAYGIGHNSFVKSPNGQEDWIVYHAFQFSNGGWGNRSVRAQAFSWNTDNTPYFGTPVAFGAQINEPAGSAANSNVRFESINVGANFIRHANSRARLDANVNPYQDSEWKLVPGLSDPYLMSFESINFPGTYLRHRNGEVWKDASDGSAGFRNDATWRKKQGVGNGDGVSFESVNFPGNYLRHRNSLFYSEPVSSTLDRNDATFWER
ncbi:MAG: family 43 glycosylhydrolase [Pseudomonadota bacterium]